MQNNRQRTANAGDETQRAMDKRIGGTVFAPGLRIPRHRATTAHICALYPFHADQGLGPRGIYIGEDVSAGGSSWHFDPFQLYTDGVITSPNILVLGHGRRREVLRGQDHALPDGRPARLRRQAPLVRHPGPEGRVRAAGRRTRAALDSRCSPAGGHDSTLSTPGRTSTPPTNSERGARR